ncbi:hypothetical protein JSO59_004030 [Riemerella anatipestifer]|uniref:hypothetical protein n=1 Tax=Riemerella anatipestifer TaxID=34085 RepID=UPI002A8801C7|nr:hypothetical protein [Riemerella anatipestifer]MDY3521298.1 hypothetical protein [Riemerella anatipestifer]MDY3532676.1 hypothetical protein [Riemerella anatipestifer]MDY3534770.1 hypothetical protein [Riemerella anatipestifer]
MEKITTILTKIGYSVLASGFVVSPIIMDTIFRDVLWYIFSLMGLIISLTIDNNDIKIKQKITFRYLVYSICVSVAVALLVGIAKAEGGITSLFTFYGLTIAGATFAPSVARQLLPKASESITEGADSLIKDFFNRFKSKNDDNNG